MVHHWLCHVFVHLYNGRVHSHSDGVDVLINFDYHTVFNIFFEVGVECVFSHRPTISFGLNVEVNRSPCTFIVKVMDWVSGYNRNLPFFRHIRLGVRSSATDELVFGWVAVSDIINRHIFLHVESKQIHFFASICFIDNIV